MESIAKTVQESQDRIVNKAASRWAFVQGEVFDHAEELGSIGIAVYAVLCRHASSIKRCYPSMPTIAKEAGCSERSVYDAIAKLSEKGLIVVLYKGNGRGKASIYEITDFREKAAPPAAFQDKGSKVESERWQKEVVKVAPVADQQQQNNRLTTSVENQFSSGSTPTVELSPGDLERNRKAITELRRQLKERGVLRAGPKSAVCA